MLLIKMTTILTLVQTGNINPFLRPVRNNSEGSGRWNFTSAVFEVQSGTPGAVRVDA